MSLETLTGRVAAYMKTQAEDAVIPLSGLLMYQRLAPTELQPALYEPVVCLILQGRKSILLGDLELEAGPGDALLISHDVPVGARILEASSARPYLSMVIGLDTSLMRSLYDEVGDGLPEPAPTQATSVFAADARLIDCLARYVALLDDDPVEARVLEPMLCRELHFRLLRAPHGGMLRELLRHDSHASNVARAISRIRRDFRDAIAVPELAREVGMSVSSFHQHFKAITSNTPLQYQKELRLMEARRLISEGGTSVTSVALDVGYTSPNQFSREYARRYGVPPSAHL